MISSAVVLADVDNVGKPLEAGFPNNTFFKAGFQIDYLFGHETRDFRCHHVTFLPVSECRNGSTMSRITPVSN
jgi:hypothetical protein